jgi:hypothetical protein
MREERRGPWYLITGIILGVALGLVYAWLVSPIAYVDTPPVSLRADYKDQYRTLIALAYASNGDLGRARARLALLGDPDPGPLVASQATRAAAQNHPLSEIQALALLAEALGSPVELLASTPTMTLAAPTPSPSATATRPPEPSSTPEAQESPSAESGNSPAETGTAPAATLEVLPQATFTPLPTLTPTATAGAPFVLTQREFVCDPNLPGPLIMVDVFDASGQPVAGAAVNLSWDGGQERFFTGLKPEIGLGYADYQMDPQVTYTLRLADGGQVISDLKADDCQGSGGGRYPGSWRLTFIQP